MKRIILFILLQFAVLMAIGSAKTTWGFQPFSIPGNSVTVPAGGDIQAAINSLPNGGTVNLAAGTFNISTAINLKSNTVLNGAGRDQTIIKLNGVGRVISIDGNIAASNVIIRNLAVDATGNGANNNAVEVWHGTDNVLLENMEIYGAGKTNLIAGWSGTSEHITFRNIISHTAAMHGLSLYQTRYGLIVDCESYNTTGCGIDVPLATYTEICNTHIHDTWGTKYPGATKIYLHDNLIENNRVVGMSPQKRESSTGLIYMHLENNTVINSGSGIIDWSDGNGELPPSFEQLVVIGNSVSGNTQNNVRIRGANNVYEYGNNIGITVLSAGSIGNLVQNQSGTPEADCVGWTSWEGGCAPDSMKSFNPSPANGSTGLPVGTGLSWSAGIGAASHDVYLGTSNPPLFVQNQANTIFAPGTLSYSTTYYWRVDERNATGVTQGVVWSFTTEAPPYTTGVVIDYDGNSYSTVTIGNQTWMADNLKVTHYPDGTPIPLVTVDSDWANLADNDTVDAYSFYNNDANSQYGALYTWAAAMGDNAVSSGANPSGVQGVCPSGWHLPSDAEWTELRDSIIADGHSGTEGTALKATSGWDGSGNGTDDYGFSGLPGGYRGPNIGDFSGAGSYGNWWSATGNNATDVIKYNLSYYVAGLIRSTSGKKSTGFSVRCVKDDVQTGLEETKGIDHIVLVYPNPATEFVILNIQSQSYNVENLSYQLYDMTGKLLENNRITGNKTNIDLRDVVPSIYFLKVIKGYKEVKTFKIIKN